jgi:hypothetical protein
MGHHQGDPNTAAYDRPAETTISRPTTAAEEYQRGFARGWID